MNSKLSQSLFGIRWCFGAVAVAALTACGGGGDGSNDSTSPIQPPIGGAAAGEAVREGSTSAPFVFNGSSFYMLKAMSRDVSGRLTNMRTEGSTGAMLEIAGTTLDGSDIKIHDIAGESTWTIGRWRKGTISFSPSRETYELRAANDSASYFAAHELTAMPTAGSYGCSLLAATKPVWGGGPSPSNSMPQSPAAYYGTTTGLMTLESAASGVAFDLALTIENNSGLLTTVRFASRIAIAGNTSYVGGIGTAGNSAAVRLFDAGAGKTGVVAMYRHEMSNGELYSGIAAWSCQGT